MEEFETTAGDAGTEGDTDNFVFRGRILPDSFVGAVRRFLLLVFMGPGVFLSLWLIGRILKR
jgi:hypothetical protein